jgi:hypothetical protein
MTRTERLTIRKSGYQMLSRALHSPVTGGSLSFSARRTSSLIPSRHPDDQVNRQRQQQSASS